MTHWNEISHNDESWAMPKKTGTSCDDEWGNQTWTVNGPSRSSKNKVIKDTDRTSRFEDQGRRKDDTMWGGGSSSFYNSVTPMHGIIPRPIRVIEENKNNGKEYLKSKEPRAATNGHQLDDYGFVHSNYKSEIPPLKTNGTAKYSPDNHLNDFGYSGTHFSSNGMNPSPYNNGDRCCYNCGKVGHLASHCRPSASNDAINGCYNCGENGHFSRECPQSVPNYNSNNRVFGRGYVPPEEADFDTLYRNSISRGINFERYSDIPCDVSGLNPPRPINSFRESGLRSLLIRNIERSGYDKPTPVQKYALPIIMEGRDLMGCAQTGSGKTAAFLVPVLHNLLEQGFETRPEELPQLPEVLIIAPTRELVIQLKDQSRKFANNSPLKSVCIYGGTSVPHQISQIKRGVNVLVATPGRLLDFLDKGFISFRNIKFFVLDEADRMLDMGFMPDIERMESHATMPRKGKRQTLMFSATFPDAIQRAASNFLDNYLFLKIGLIGSANSDVTQSIFRCHKFEKRETLLSIFKDLQNIEKTLIFVQQKKMTDFLASYLCQNEVMSTTIHGDRLQEEREEALYQFSRGKMPVLVATDCAARGLDIPDVAHVINYDLPKSMDEYVHRIGRTGRVGNTGRASSFYDPEDDANMAQNLVKVLVDSNQEVPDWLQKEGERQSMVGCYGGFGGYSGKDIRQKNKYESSLGHPFATKPSEPLEEDELWE